MSTDTADVSRVTFLLPLLGAAIAAALATAAATTLSPVSVGAWLFGVLALLLVRSNTELALVGLAASRATLEGAHVLPLANVGGNGLSPGDILSLAFLAGAAWHLIDEARSGTRIWRLPTVLPVLLFLGVAVFSLSYSPVPSLGLRDILKFMAAYCAYLIVVVGRPEPRRLRMLLGALLIGSVMPISYGLYEAFFSKGEVNVFYGWARAQSVFDSPNTYGFYLVTIVAAAWALRQQVTGRARVLTTVMGVAAFSSVLLTLSRNSMAALAILVLSIGWNHRSVLIVAALATVGVIAAAPQVLARGLEFFNSQSDQGNSLLGRLEIWRSGIAFWRGQPLLGRGWGATSTFVTKNAHNDYLRSLIEAGIVGLGCFIAMMSSLLRLGRNAARGRDDGPRALLGLSIGYALVSLASNNFGKGAFQIHFWLLAGVLCVWADAIPARGFAARGVVTDAPDKFAR
ncbi:MAG: O-antigen ligase family protein [Actinobacteria bacterium]|nr:O-antigen ligase family protein [Actinomycetota bacterium]